MRTTPAILLAALLGLPGTAFAQPFDLYAGLKPFVAEGSNIGGQRKDYETVIQHPDGSLTIITDEGNVHKVEGSGVVTEQTVGRGGASHLDVIRTHYRPLQGDQILSIERIFSDGHMTKIFPTAAMVAQKNARAKANAAGLSRQRQEIAEANAPPPPPEQKRPPNKDRVDTGHDRDQPPREAHPHVELGGGSVTAKYNGPQ